MPPMSTIRRQLHGGAGRRRHRHGFGTLHDDRGRGVDLHAGQRNATVQALNGGGTLTDTFTVTTADGTAQVVTVTINGTNDAAVISGISTGAVIEAGGVGSGIPGTPVATAIWMPTDVDNPPDDWTPVAAATPGVNGFGTYTMTAAGVWTYTLDNAIRRCRRSTPGRR